MRYYDGLESRPVFESVEAMLKWAGLFNLTTITLGEKLEEVGLSSILVQELVTVSTILISSFPVFAEIDFFLSVVEDDNSLAHLDLEMLVTCSCPCVDMPLSHYEYVSNVLTYNLVALP